MRRPNRRTERLLFASLITILTGTSAIFTALFYRLMKRYGEVLLELESARQGGERSASHAPADARAKMFPNGAPVGSVALNFELPSVDGEQYTFTRLKRDRTILIFIAPDCQPSLDLLGALSRQRFELDSPHCRIAFISTGTMSENRELADRFEVGVPLLVQERDEVANLYIVSTTPTAYVFGLTSMSEMERLTGPRDILAVVSAALAGSDVLPNETSTPLPQYERAGLAPLCEGDPLPEFSARLLDGGTLRSTDLLGQRTLLVMFDPYCEPCLRLLPELSQMHAKARPPKVLMISRRDPALTHDIVTNATISFPVGYQDNWEVSRQIGALATPAACLIDPDGFLESDVAIGRQATGLLLRQAITGRPPRRLMALTSILRGRR